MFQSSVSDYHCLLVRCTFPRRKFLTVEDDYGCAATFLVIGNRTGVGICRKPVKPRAVWDTRVGIGNEQTLLRNSLGDTRLCGNSEAG
jgi:hypothetical protein